MKKNLNHYFNFLGWTFNLIRYRNKKDPFKEFHKLRKNERIPKPSKGNVLIIPIRVSPISNLFEGIIGFIPNTSFLFAPHIYFFSIHML